MTSTARQPNRVVAHFLDGRCLRGYTLDFLPNQAYFTLCQTLADLQRGGTPIYLQELKAVYFVKRLDTTEHTGATTLPLDQKLGPSSRGIIVKFKDGELFLGATQAYSPDRPGFFVQPLDPNTNNERIYILRAATQIVHTLMPLDSFSGVLAKLGLTEKK